MGNGGEGWFQTPSIKVGLHGIDPNPQFSIFFNVADLDAAIIRVNELGGQTEAPGPHEPGFGRFCLCRDPQGIQFGLHQPPDDIAHEPQFEMVCSLTDSELHQLFSTIEPTRSLVEPVLLNEQEIED